VVLAPGETILKRRDFITLLGGAAAAWPLAARAQQSARMRRVGVLLLYGADDSVGQALVAQFRQGLQELGWTEGRNVTIDVRWGASDADRYRSDAAKLVALGPDVVVAGSGGIARASRQASGSVPIVFTGALDPVGAGLVDSLARPGGNTTGFSGVEYGESAKLLELLKQMAPRLTRAAVIRDPTAPGGGGVLGAIQAATGSMGVEVRPIGSQDAGAIERGVAAFASGPNGGLVVPPTASALIHRELIITLAARYRLPAVYADRVFVAGGGLISYGAVLTDSWRRAAGYVDRILKGEKPADLPVQAPTKYETVINLKTAKALGIEVPPSLLARADDVIE
jgi:putative tryptophan/tyrosine transport system substrate-binding protein